MARIYADYAAWALGFGGFLAYVGGVLVAPSNPTAQLLWTGSLAVATVPVTYRVVARAWVRRERGAPRRLVVYFVAVTLAGTAAALAAGSLGGRTTPTRLVRAAAFLVAFGVTSWAMYGRDDDPE